MVRLTNNPGEDDGYRLDPYYYSGIYTTTVKEAQYHIMDENRRKKDELKKTVKLFSSVKKVAHIIKRGRSYDNILDVVSNLLSTTNTTEDSTESILQATPNLSSETLKNYFIHMGGHISELTDFRKLTTALEIERR